MRRSRPVYLRGRDDAVELADDRDNYLSRCQHGWLELLTVGCSCKGPPSPIAGWHRCNCQTHQQSAGRADYCKSNCTDADIELAYLTQKLADTLPDAMRS